MCLCVPLCLCLYVWMVLRLNFSEYIKGPPGLGAYLPPSHSLPLADVINCLCIGGLNIMLGSQVCTSSLAWRGLVGALGSVRPLPGSPWTLAYGPEARSGLTQLAAGKDYGLLHHDCWVTPHLELSSAASSMVA